MNELLIKENNTLYQAMEKLQNTAKKCLIVIDTKKIYKGTITDGDIRRYILSNKNLNGNISRVYNKKSIFFYEDNIDLKKIRDKILSDRVLVIPVINSKRKVIKIIETDDLFVKNKIINTKKENIDANVVIMAGGKGSRLSPFTNILPKPLLPINDKTLIEIVINQFNTFKVTKFFISLNYKKEIIKSYLKELGINHSIKYIIENKELGTSGSLKLMKNYLKKPFFVTNCDTIINDNFGNILKYHKENKNEITLVACMKKVTTPYGICIINKNGNLSKIIEKPSSNNLVNTGMYVVNPKVISLIPKDKFFNFNELIQKAITKKYKVGIYPISEKAWIDVGQWEEYQKAIKIL